MVMDCVPLLLVDVAAAPEAAVDGGEALEPPLVPEALAADDVPVAVCPCRRDPALAAIIAAPISPIAILRFTRGALSRRRTSLVRSWQMPGVAKNFASLLRWFVPKAFFSCALARPAAYNCAMPPAESPLRVVHAVCSHDCPDSCAVLVSVDAEGRARKVAGDPDHPVTRGFLCGKVALYLDRVYSPDRLLYPMRRRPGVAKGPIAKGQEADSFERISWDEALDAIAERLAEVAAKHGPESVLPYSYAGTIGVLGYGSMDRRFFHRLGASQLDRTICSTAGGDALLSVYGRKLGTDTEQFHRARLIIAWGANIHGNAVPFVAADRAGTARRRPPHRHRPLPDAHRQAGRIGTSPFVPGPMQRSPWA